MRRSFCALTVPFVVFAMSCSSQTSDAGAVGDAGADTSVDGAREADAPSSACRPLAELCAQVPCLLDWPADLTAFCSVGPDIWHFLPDGCGYRFAMEEWSGDNESRYFYDTKTGKPVAVTVYIDMHYAGCYGPADFAEPDCSTGQTSFYCGDLDAGTDGGSDGSAEAAPDGA